MMDRKYALIRLWLLPAIGILLLSVVVVENQAVLADSKGSVRTYLTNALQGHGGLGDAGYYHNPVLFTGMEPGDILIGGYPNCAYGEYSHAALYIGEGKGVEGYGEFGVHVRDIEHFRSYSQVAILKVQADPKVKMRAVEYALGQVGKAFYPLAFKPGERIWNCTKIMWKAYAEQGIDLDILHDLWVTPESLKSSPYVKVIRESKV